MKFAYRHSDDAAKRIQEIHKKNQERVAKAIRDALNEVARSALRSHINCRRVVDLPKEAFAPGYWPKGYAIRM
jgi:hypothetical protein